MFSHSLGINPLSLKIKYPIAFIRVLKGSITANSIKTIKKQHITNS